MKLFHNVKNSNLNIYTDVPVSPNKPTNQTTTDGKPGDSDHGVDGKTDVCTQTHPAKPGQTIWWFVDLGHAHVISSVAITNSKERGRSGFM